MKAVRIVRFVKFDGVNLWIREGESERMLGTITTRNGGLTRELKLKAVAGQGDWIRI